MRSARAQQCTLGGHRVDRPGAFVEATVLSGVTPEMRAYREELFGPAAVVYKTGPGPPNSSEPGAGRFGRVQHRLSRPVRAMPER